MKRISVLIALLISTFAVSAQHEVLPFLDAKGKVRIETTELNALADSLVTVSHRADDIAWSRVVYRIIDMRYKQNNPLYYPSKFEEGMTERSLFMIMTDAIIDGMPFYFNSGTRVEPNYSDLMKPEAMSTNFTINPTATETDEEDLVISLDTTTNALKFNFRAYEKFVPNQLKFLIQEVVFFDKHTSRLYSKIIAIAPMWSGGLSGNESPKDALSNSIIGWFIFDELRPYLAKHYVGSNTNNTKRVTFEEFFAKKLYSSYIVGDDNIYERTILEYAKTEEEVKKEQQRIFDELLNFEQDLWEY